MNRIEELRRIIESRLVSELPREVAVLQEVIADIRRKSPDAKLAVAGGPLRSLAEDMSVSDVDAVITKASNSLISEVLASKGQVEYRGDTNLYHLNIDGLREIGLFPAKYGPAHIDSLEGCIKNFDVNINSIGVEILPDGLGKFIDPCDGLSGLVNGIITLNDVPQLAATDRARTILRYFRFVSKLNFDTDEKSIAYVKRNARIIRKAPYAMRRKESRRVGTFKGQDRLKELYNTHIKPFLEIESEAKYLLRTMEYTALRRKLECAATGQKICEGILVESKKAQLNQDTYLDVGSTLIDYGSYLRVRDLGDTAEVTLKLTPSEQEEGVLTRTEYNSPLTTASLREFRHNPTTILSLTEQVEPLQKARQILGKRFSNLQPCLYIENGRQIAVLSTFDSKVELALDRPKFFEPLSRKTVGGDYELELELLAGEVEGIKPFKALWKELNLEKHTVPKLARGLQYLAAA